MPETTTTLEVGTCPCGAVIFWGVTAKNGRPVPLDKPESRFVMNHEGKMVLVKTYKSHHATCPQAAKFR